MTALTSRTTGIRNRKITTRYAIGDIVDGRDSGTRYAEIATSHYRERKALITRLTYIDVIEVEPGYTIEKWGSDYPYATIAATAIARYSDKALTAQHVEAATQFEMGLVDKAVATILLAAVIKAQEEAA